ncbi:18540_t:CDS:2 [Funneliformis geosporum]|nr:18540_t:CDS:2 [Funneliformis geosporum]
MVDTKQIVDIQSAKSLDYDGRKLTDQEKEIFDDDNLREPGSTEVNLTKLKKAAELLEVIIKAKKADSFDDDLYTALNKARTETEVIKALNKNMGYQNAIDHLISKRGKKPDKPDKTKDDLNTLIDDRNTKISVLENKIARIERLQEIVAKDQGELVEKVEKQKRKTETLEDLKTLMNQQTPVAGRPLHGVTLNGYIDDDNTTKTGHANELLEKIVTEGKNAANVKEKYFNTNIRSKSNFFSKAGLSATDKARGKGTGCYPRYYAKSDGTIISKEISKRNDFKKLLDKFPSLIHELNINIEKTKNYNAHAQFIKDTFSKAGGGFFSSSDFNSSISNFENYSLNTLRELLYVKAIRQKPEITKEVISDEEILKITRMSRDSIFKERKKEGIEFSRFREIKEVRLALTPYKKTSQQVATSKIDMTKPVTTAAYRIDTSPLDLLISREKAQLLTLEGKKNITSSGGVKFYEEIINLQLQKAELEQEVLELEKERDKLGKQDPSTIKSEFKAIFGTDLTADIKGKFTRIQVSILRAKLDAIKAKETPMEKWFVDAENKLEKDHLADTREDKFKSVTDKTELEKYRKAYEEAGKIVKLLQSEINEQEAIRKRIAGEDAPPPPTVKISEVELKTAFGNIDGVVDKNFGIDKTKIEEVVKMPCGSDKKPTSEFISHLKSEGLDDGTKLNEKDDADKM